ncbi:MAG: 23S rRNA (adenine(1618)-N(6))-methyltransferase RlmF [Cyclobacteriaceae bacterium]
MIKKNTKTHHKLHPRNKHQGRYDFDGLVEKVPSLEAHLISNRQGESSIDFSNTESVKLLNTALLSSHYGINYWDIPANYLTPAIPGRAEYIHYMADWLRTSNFGRIPNGKKIMCLDIGVGANLIYPIIGICEYNWRFIGSDIDTVSLQSAERIIDFNESLREKVDLRLQKDPSKILSGIINKEECIDLSVCNPPFHDSAGSAQQAANRKVGNLTGKRTKKAPLNFSGQPNELWCKGGERGFIRNYISESKTFGSQCFWFSTLVSKKSNIPGIHTELEKARASKQQIIPLGIGNKSSHIVTWTFLSREEQNEWRKRWES